MTDHPFPQDVVRTVADEYERDRDELERTLERIQTAIERDEGKYEYSSQHTFAWEDPDAFYLYGDGIWETLEEELPVERRSLTAARAVHRTHMIESAKRRDEDETVAEQLEEGTEALIVANTASGEPMFGQDV